jgi:hypothetical protein
MRTIIENDESGISLVFPRSSIKGMAGAMAASLTEEGSRVSASLRREEWRFESIEDKGEETHLRGPRFVGRSLDSAESLEDGMQLLRSAARALEFLSREGHLQRGLVSTGILIGPEGDVLVLPAGPVARALAAQRPDVRAAAAARLVHPRSTSAEADAVFLLAQAAYRFASGSAPYPREAADASSSAPPSPPVLGAKLAAPRLNPELASLIDRSLAEPASVSLLEWRVALDEAAERGWLRHLSPDEGTELARLREEAVQKARRKDAVSTFFRKYGLMLGGIAAGAALLAVITVSTIRARNDGPDLSALSPRQVVEAYYHALDSLDIETLEAAADKKAAAADSTIVTNLYILTRTRLAYEGIDSMVSASKWKAAGMRPLNEGEILFGVTDLVLKEDVSASSEELGSRRSISASYSLWYIERDEGEWGTSAKVVEDKRVDDLVLEKTKKGWRIVELTRRPG